MPITSNNRYTTPDWTTQKLNAAELNAIDGTVEDITTPVGQIILSRIDPGSQYIPCDGSATDLTAYPELANVELVDVVSPNGNWAPSSYAPVSGRYMVNGLAYSGKCWLATSMYFRTSTTSPSIRSYTVRYTTNLNSGWTNAFSFGDEDEYNEATSTKFLNGVWVVTGNGESDAYSTTAGRYSYSTPDATTGEPTTWQHIRWYHGGATKGYMYNSYMTGAEYDVDRQNWLISAYAWGKTTGASFVGARPYIGTSNNQDNWTYTMLSAQNIVAGDIKYYNGISVIAARTHSRTNTNYYYDYGSPVVFVTNSAGTTMVSLGDSAVYDANWSMVECYNGTWVLAPYYVPSGNTAGIFVSTNPTKKWDYIASPFTSSTSASYWHSLKCIDGWWMIGDNSGSIYTTQDPTGLWEKKTILTAEEISDGGAITVIGGRSHTGADDGTVATVGSRPRYKWSDTSISPVVYVATENTQATPKITSMFGVDLPADTSAYIKAVSDTAYTAQTWRNNNSPYISAANLTALTDRVSEKQAEHGDIRLFVNQAPATTEATWVAVMPVPPDELGVTFCTLAEDEEVN